MQQMSVYGVSFDLVGKQPIVLLKTMDGNRFLPGVEVRRPVHLAAEEQALHTVLEAADQEHPAVEIERSCRVRLGRIEPRGLHPQPLRPVGAPRTSRF